MKITFEVEGNKVVSTEGNPVAFLVVSQGYRKQALLECLPILEKVWTEEHVNINGLSEETWDQVLGLIEQIKKETGSE